MKTALEKYDRRKAKYNILRERQNKFLNKISSLRLIAFLLGLIISVKAYTINNYYILTSAVLCTVVLFSYLVYLYRKVNRNIKYTTALIEINQNNIARINGEWKSFVDSGKDFIDENHSYSYDLDVFGKDSLFQWINSANTYCGREQLKKAFTEKPENEEAVHVKQIAVAELAKRVSFRERLMAEGLKIKGKAYPVEELLLWIKEKNENMWGTNKILFFRILTALTSITLLVSAADFLLTTVMNPPLTRTFSVPPYYFLILFIFIQCIFLKINREERLRIINIAEKYSKDIKCYKSILKHIEKYKFKSEHLKNLCKEVSCDTSASMQIESFSKICDSIAQRRSMLYPILNMLFMLEYRWVIRLEKWKAETGMNFEKWIKVIGEFEALSSLSVICYDNPSWTMPRILRESSKFIAENMGHPLLGESKVCNNIQIQQPRTVMLVTGSNMSGKSTLMRTAGINLVLAYAGAPVCAEKFECAIMDLYSCMRINDNLEKNISSFYAEILKIKNIVKASREGKHVFFLLDEIFRGTNSKDRHTGAAILIRQLSKSGNIGIVSTHDLELGEMEKESNSKVRNYHFSEYYKDNEIYFDYKLKPGVSTTRNAIFLMKLAGIEIKE